MKPLVLRISLLAFSLFVALVACELLVRALFPELRELADFSFREDKYRIFANSPNDVEWRRHPDTGDEHLVMTNSLGMRQHREFAPAKAEGVTRIGVFGDSFTENVRLEVPYSFSEPLEYLLTRAGNRVEVMNFAVDGYGTDQMYLQYRHETGALGLDVVVYLCCHNDPIDIYTNKLYRLDGEGGLRYVPRKRGSPLARCVQRLALTYLVMRARGHNDQRLTARVYGRNRTKDKAEALRRKRAVRDEMKAFSESEVGSEALALFGALLAKWQAETKRRGHDFVVVLLPRWHSLHDPIRKVIVEGGFPLIDLAELVLREEDLGPSLFFENDSHWNEAGNQHAAAHLFRELSARHGWEHADDDAFIREVLSQYYGVFGKGPVGEAWLDPDAKPLPGEKAARLRDTFLHLEKALPPEE